MYTVLTGFGGSSAVHTDPPDPVNAPERSALFASQAGEQSTLLNAVAPLNMLAIYEQVEGIFHAERS